MLPECDSWCNSLDFSGKVWEGRHLFWFSEIPVVVEFNIQSTHVSKCLLYNDFNNLNRFYTLIALVCGFTIIYYFIRVKILVQFYQKVRFPVKIPFILPDARLLADGGSISSKSEESGSQYGFFISDEDVDMAEEMPTSLLAYSEITESTYEKLFPDSDAEVPDSETRRQLLNNWCRKLCSLLAEYTNSHSGERDVTDKTLLGFKKYCPWKTSERQSHVSSELALLCVRDSCYESLIPYSVVPLSDLTEPLIGCLIDAGSPDDDEPIVTLTLDSVFLSAFWFLLDENRILDYIEELVVTDINRSRCLWRSLINCLLSKLLTP